LNYHFVDDGWTVAWLAFAVAEDVQSNRTAGARNFHGVFAEDRPPAVGFKMCAALYCAAPLGILGSIADGLSGYFYPLLIKGIMDGLATMGLARTFRWGPVVSAVPVLAFQGSVALLGKIAGQWLGAGELLDNLNAVAGC